MKLVGLLTRLVWLLLFGVLLLFALRNSDPVVLRLYAEQSVQMPLVLLLFVFFAAGTVVGVVACLVRMLRQRREILALRRELHARPAAGGRAGPLDAVSGSPGAGV